MTAQLEKVDDGGQEGGKLDLKEVGKHRGSDRGREEEREIGGKDGNGKMTGWSGDFSRDIPGNVFSASPCHREIIPC